MQKASEYNMILKNRGFKLSISHSNRVSPYYTILTWNPSTNSGINGEEFQDVRIASNREFRF